jgi:hypothetical protein
MQLNKITSADFDAKNFFSSSLRHFILILPTSPLWEPLILILFSHLLLGSPVIHLWLPTKILYALSCPFNTSYYYRLKEYFLQIKKFEALSYVIFSILVLLLLHLIPISPVVYQSYPCRNKCGSDVHVLMTRRRMRARGERVWCNTNTRHKRSAHLEKQQWNGTLNLASSVRLFHRVLTANPQHKTPLWHEWLF